MRIYIHILPSQLIEELPSIESSFANPYFEYKHSIYIYKSEIFKKVFLDSSSSKFGCDRSNDLYTYWYIFYVVISGVLAQIQRAVIRDFLQAKNQYNKCTSIPREKSKECKDVGKRHVNLYDNRRNIGTPMQ